MNLHQIASGAISSVNPFIPMFFTINQGYDTESDGTRIPKTRIVNTIGQWQNITAKELQHLQGMNLQGDLGVIYVNGSFDGVVRSEKRGGDTVSFNNKCWLVVQVLEQWPDWCKLAICLQSNDNV